MKQMQRSFIAFLFVSVAVAGLFSCKKDSQDTTTTNTDSGIAQAIQNLQAVAVGTTSATSNRAADSIYVINTCARGDRRDSVSFSELPSAIGTYLTSNYSGYTLQKAFAVKSSSNNSTAYIVIIQYNGNPIGLKFDANGSFVQVLEQRQGSDLNGSGWHQGGYFEHRGGIKKDTVALNDLPSAITTYYTSNYPQDTLVSASVTRNGSFIVLSRNNGLFATAFTSAGSFIERQQLPIPVQRGSVASLTQNALPADVQSYLSSTYPNYVFEKAYSVTVNGTVQGYVVVIEANSTKYAVVFDGSGNFLKSKAIY